MTNKPDRKFRLYGTVTVGTRGQIVIPRRLRRELTIQAGESLMVLAGPLPDTFVVRRLPEDLIDLAATAIEPSRGPAAEPPSEARNVLTRELANVAVFARLAPEVVERIAGVVQQRRYPPGALIDREGEPCTAMYVVRSGRVRRYKASPDGREQVLAILGPGEAFNEVPIFDGGPNPASTEALEPTDLYVVDRERLLVLMDRYPAVAIGLTRTLAVRLRHLTTIIEDLSFRQVAARLARILLDEADERTGVFQVSQQGLASMVGTAREVVSRALRRIEGAGAIAVERGRVVVRDREALRAFV